MAEKFDLLESEVGSPREKRRSRIGSAQLAVKDGGDGDGGKGKAGVPMRAKTKGVPVDKGVLLNYLDGVVREGRK